MTFPKLFWLVEAGLLVPCSLPGPSVIKQLITSEKKKRGRKGDPFQGPRVGSCITLGNELSEETHELTKQELLLEKGAQA